MRIVKAGALAAALVAAVGVATRLQAQTYFGQNQVQYDHFAERSRPNISWCITTPGTRRRDGAARMAERAYARLRDC
jgi:hypothetical protein